MAKQFAVRSLLLALSLFSISHAQSISDIFALVDNEKEAAAISACANFLSEDCTPDEEMQCIRIAAALYTQGSSTLPLNAFLANLTSRIPEDRKASVNAKLTGKIACDAISSSDESLATDALNLLLDTEINNAEITVALAEISTAASDSGQYDFSLLLGKELDENWPQSDAAIRHSLRLFKMHVARGKKTEADAVQYKLQTMESDSSELWEALKEIGSVYRKLGKTGKARRLFDHVNKKWPDSPNRIFSDREYIASDMQDGVVVELSRIQEFADRYAEDVHIPLAMFWIAQECYDRAIERQSRFAKKPNAFYYRCVEVVNLIEERKISEGMSDTERGLLSYYAGCCHLMMGHNEKAKSYFSITAESPVSDALRKHVANQIEKL